MSKPIISTPSPSFLKERLGAPVYRAYRFANIFTSYVELEYLRRVKKVDNKYIGRWTKEKLISMGPTFIKIGQFMSTRSDIFGEEITHELKDLHDNVAPLHFKDLKPALTSIKKNFKRIQEQPIASASIGQVHVGELATGEAVVLKIRRPGIEEQIIDDFEMLLFGIHVLDKLSDDRKIKEFSILFNEYFKILKEEIDFEREAASMRLFKKNFAGRKWVKIPKVYDDLCSENVIAMEYVPSTKITDVASLDRQDYDKEKIAQKFVELFIDQIIKHGVVHIDPHPGNVGITSTGKIVFYDFGMILHLDKNLKDRFKSFLIAVYDKDINAIASIAIEMGLIVVEPEDVSYFKTFLIAFQNYIDTANLEDFKISYLSKLNKTSTPFVISSKFILLLRGISILEGVCKTLDPKFNFRKTLDPYIDEFIIDVNYLEARALNDIKIFTNVPAKVQETHIQLEVLEKQMQRIENDAKNTQTETFVCILSLLLMLVMQHEFGQGLTTAALLGLSYSIIVNGKVHK